MFDKENRLKLLKTSYARWKAIKKLEVLECSEEVDCKSEITQLIKEIGL